MCLIDYNLKCGIKKRYLKTNPPGRMLAFQGSLDCGVFFASCSALLVLHLNSSFTFVTNSFGFSGVNLNCLKNPFLLLIPTCSFKSARSSFKAQKVVLMTGGLKISIEMRSFFLMTNVFRKNGNLHLSSILSV